jgi:hypothetical protein
MRRHRRTATILAVLLIATAVAAGCSSGSSPSSSPPTSARSTTTSTEASPGTTQQPGSQAIVFLSVGGNIDAYAAAAPYTRQRVVAAGTAPQGIEPHGQICFAPDGSRRFVVAETRPAAPGAPAAAGFGIYQLTGDHVGAFRVRRLAGVLSPSAPGSAPSTYGCAFLRDGRLLTTDVGSSTGAGTGQLILWFPPLTTTSVGHCVVGSGIASPGGLAADSRGGVALTSSRAPGAGLWDYQGQFPTSAQACGTLDQVRPDAPAGTPRVVTGVAAVQLVVAGAHGLSAPSAVASSADGTQLLVSSPPDGVIDAFRLDGTYSSTVLSPPDGTRLGPTPLPTGSPEGLVVNADGTVFYADTGLVVGPAGAPVAAPLGGSLRRIAVQDGQVQAPQVVSGHLPGPDGIGLLDPERAAGGAPAIT